MPSVNTYFDKIFLYFLYTLYNCLTIFAWQTKFFRKCPFFSQLSTQFTRTGDNDFATNFAAANEWQHRHTPLSVTLRVPPLPAEKAVCRRPFRCAPLPGGEAYFAGQWAKENGKNPVCGRFALFSMHSVQKFYINIVKNFVLTDDVKSSKIRVDYFMEVKACFFFRKRGKDPGKDTL